MSLPVTPNDSAPVSRGVLRDCFTIAKLVCDANRRITECDAEVGRWLGSDKSLVGEPLAALPHGLAEIAEDLIAGKKTIVDRQVHLAVGREEAITLRVHGVAVSGRNGQEAGAVMLLNDLARLRKVEQSLHRLDRLATIGTLSASLAHEIKNSLVAVKTFVDLLLEKNQDAELAEVVSREMKLINSLVSQMMRVASPAKSATKAVSVHEVLDFSLRLLQHQIREKLIAVRPDFTANHDSVRGNAHQLEQAFMNLFLNAVEAMGPHGELGVTTDVCAAGPEGAPHIRIQFRDSGIGISPEATPHIFDTFFTTKRNGTGLGLPITRRIIHEHCGEITVQSAAGQGAVFVVTLPLLSLEK